MDQMERDYLEARLKSLEMACALIQRRLKDEKQTSLFSFLEAA
jgi:hypothetical protein